MTAKKSAPSNNGGWDLANKALTACLTIGIAGVLGLGWNAAQVPELKEQIATLGKKVEVLNERLDKHDLQLQALDIRMTNHHRRTGPERPAPR